MLEWLIGKRRENTTPRVPATIMPEEVIALLEQGEKVVILDVRQQHEYRSGHIKGAQLIPLMELNKRLHELKKDATIITVCHSGRRSAQAARLLRAEGFTVRNMVGGMMKWPGKVVK
ncbi:rhodanese-like domain-containing protein [Sulfobacillus thermosulfidooxidans]|uniref:rhodanese-like domain-containing protein n=1 Tax=Sulfobacillus thermosulfidooxidans TaxID=28034 RepID=UPI0006B57289|nr:rhodanese-like domain-containing protein [Sulfobacillus thermosulfidooxidans]